MSKKHGAAIVAFLMIAGMVALTACGDKGAKSNDPNVGVWNATSGEMMGIAMDADDLFEEGFSIELKAGGKCTTIVDGEKINGKWTLEDGAFALSGGGFDSSGRLEDGLLVLEDVMGMGFSITLEKEGGSPVASASAAQKPGANSDGPVGVWVGKTVILPGEEPSESFMGMMAVSDCITMEMKDDGSVRLLYIGEPVNTIWKENGKNAGTVDFDGTPVVFELIDGELHLYIGEKGGAESLEYVLEASSTGYDELTGGGGSASGGLPDPGLGGGTDAGLDAYDHPEHVRTFEGDWFGVIYFEEGFGEWEHLTDTGFNVAARFSFADGDCEAFFSTEVDPGEEHLDFKDISAWMGTNGISIDGRLLGLMFENTLARASEDDPAILYVYTEDDEDGFDATVYLRRWGEKWKSTDPWTPSSTNLTFIAERSFEEIVEILGGDPTQVPAPTYLAGERADDGGIGGGLASGNKDDSGGQRAAAGNDATDVALKKYNLDATSDDWLDMSADRLTEDELLEKYEIVRKEPQYSMDYDAVVSLVGVEPSDYRFDGKYRIFRWKTQEDDYHYINLLFEEQNGEWLYSFYSKTNM